MKVSSINPRKLAVIALCRVESDGAYSNITLNSFFKEYELSSQDKALCTSLFYGTLDRKITLDYILRIYIKTGLNKIKPYTLNVLRTAVYQLMYMDKIPESAAVNEAVKIIKSSKESFNSGFVNGVLRNFLRNRPEIPMGDSASDISVRFSAPLWIVESLIEDYSAETAKKYLEATLLSPPTYVRVNTKKCSLEELSDRFVNEGVVFEETELNGTLCIKNYSSIEALDSFRNGLFFVQDIACQMAVSSLGIEDNDSILDLCSAPGGKAFYSALSADNLTIVATDLYEQRVKLIKNGARRLGFDNIRPMVSDATTHNPNIGLFNKVICDVPCSGLGVLRRKPDIKYRTENDFSDLHDIQLSIIRNADNYLKPGGKILYSTCTLRKAENENLVNEFLREFTNYELITQKTYFPHVDGSDGFYSAVLLKR